MLAKLLPAHTLLLSVAFAALLIGCQSAPPAPPSAAEVAETARIIEKATVRDLTLIRECHALGGDVGAQATAVRETWNFANQPLSDRAQGFLASQRTDFIELEDRQVSLGMLRSLYETSRSARDELNLNQRAASVKPQVCKRYLDQVEDRDYAAELVTPRLEQALNSHNVAEQNYLSVQVAGELYRDWPEPGRSFFSASERLKGECASDLDTLTLHNQWPSEVYARYCREGAPAVLRCEWGKCQSVTPTANESKTQNTE